MQNMECLIVIVHSELLVGVSFDQRVSVYFISSNFKHFEWKNSKRSALAYTTLALKP